MPILRAFDIETAPLDYGAIWRRQGLDPCPPLPKEFDESEVKLGNLKDETKIAEKISAARAMHLVSVEELGLAHYTSIAKAVERATLDPRTGRVCAIGYADQNGDVRIVDEFDADEATMIAGFWEEYERAWHKSGILLVGHNCFKFDLPFLAKRSWALGVEIPPEAFHFPVRKWSPGFRDTMEAFALGDYRAEFFSLDSLAEFLGAPRKNGSGKDFHLLLHSDREAAHEYLRGDLLSTIRCAERMGLG